ncbi:unnamed protein product [Vitrella brassicaformis CCMP3155]|uniref:Neuroguidin n=1 Tax=Vitrella brassicaformis (strain CCMP3155) TaxID=1169540 RepID=A0A0G4GC39_VITBC|nr:unnamed protein product [Vitrella brassicaformis CCMP3155]|eukprot:CEM26714.1 unnamed protein product [Vitrella brassicaformis CCMP3155]
MNGDHHADTERDAVEDPLVDYEALRRFAAPPDGTSHSSRPVKGKAESLRKKLESLNETIDGTSIHVDKGISYLDVKAQLLLTYTIYLTYYTLLKVKGASVSPHPVVDELVLLRTLMEKMRPIDQRLAYQVNRLLDMAAKPIQEAASEAAQPLRPRLDQLMNPNEADEEQMEQSDEQEGEGEVPEEKGEGEGEVAAKGVYKPPKLLAVEYTGDHLSAAAKAHREADRQRERLKKTEYVRSLRQEISDVPEEVGGSDLRRDAKAAALMRRQVERQQIEEESFRRIQINKKEKREMHI